MQGCMKTSSQPQADYVLRLVHPAEFDNRSRHWTADRYIRDAKSRQDKSSASLEITLEYLVFLSFDCPFAFACQVEYSPVLCINIAAGVCSFVKSAFSSRRLTAGPQAHIKMWDLRTRCLAERALRWCQ